MRRALLGCAALLMASVLSHPLAAQQAKPAAATGIRAEILRHIDDARDKLIALAEATPADKFTWRPNDKVRTTGEVFAHVTGGNYYIPTLWGTQPPAGIDMKSFDKEAGDKAKTIASLKKSFEHVHHVIESASDADMEKAIKLFGGDGTEREGFLILATHAHEHLGQSIAYARSAGIVPPWSK